MDINNFIESFEYLEINIKRYFLVVIFIFIIFLISIFTFKVNDYIEGNLFFENNESYLVLDIKEINKIKNNKKIIIERNTFTYLYKKIENLYQDNKKVYIEVDNFPKSNNEIYKYRIEVKKKNIFEIIKGEG